MYGKLVPAGSLTTNYMLLRECGHLSSRKRLVSLSHEMGDGWQGEIAALNPLYPSPGPFKLGWKVAAQISPGLGQAESPQRPGITEAVHVQCPHNRMCQRESEL